MNRRAYLAAVGTGVSATLAGCASVLGAFDGEEYQIGMSRNAFDPEEYEATVGETVVWQNTSSADHTVTALEDGIPDAATYFASGGYDDEETARAAWHDYRGGRIGPRETYEHTFEIPGRYVYICEPHFEPGTMAGTVVVTE
ncbi:cupredoxin domain-containing protein [Natronobacterium gregoryi]|uniref:Blue (Type 1) copper domain-containing protein n=2 Tax=Natronobacterium gregoryi TaxID=44930 RepID=L0AGH8_NATGS|nr:plastocyanin/azurin family copper-binding protein [Natronobacterium gregoryi]AFZ72160.1 plastocyanin [Natronobacterium gregoryi SP2]ELY63067.1 blue (type 1) copper domain-containing protein [Natronobacterium gregoryi SP2]PLK20106.1 halocyanin [Natronobacterium gregoryi SP2]SFJ33186.1 Plastocyanin [Natronobacterium gregoryi]